MLKVSGETVDTAAKPPKTARAGPGDRPIMARSSAPIRKGATMKIGPGVRAGIAAGISAGIAFAALTSGGGGSVRVETASVEDEAVSTTTTAAPEQTPTTVAPTTTAPAPTTTTTLSMEDRLARIEATTTTTTLREVLPPSVHLQPTPAIVDGVVTLTILYLNNGDQNARALVAFPNPRVRVAVTVNAAEREFVLPIPPGGEGKILLPLPDVPADSVPYGLPAHVVSTEWDSLLYGGVLPTGAGHPWTGN